MKDYFGYEDGKAATPFTDEEEAYNRGLNEAWDAARKIAVDVIDGGYSLDELREIFDETLDRIIFKRNTASEAIAKIKAYEDEQTEDAKIKVGDEVKIIGSDPMYDDYCDCGVCTYVHIDKIYVMRKDGSASTEHESEWEKTGRTFPQIAEVLKEMRGAENDE